MNPCPPEQAPDRPRYETTDSPQRPLAIAQWVRLRWWNACAWYAVTLAEALARRGHRSYVLAPPGTPAAREAARRGLPVPDIGDPGALSPGEWVRSGRKIRPFLAEQSIDLVNVHSGPGHARFSRACRSRGLPLVRTRGDIRPPRPTPWLRRLYREGTDHHLAAADFIRDRYYGPLGIPPERITTLRGGIDLGALEAISREEARAALLRRLGLKGDPLLLGMAARLSPVKGHATVLRALASLAPRFGQAHAVFAGPEAQLSVSDLEREAALLGLAGRVHVLGRVEDPFRIAAALDIAVIASLDSEAICRSALEYLGLGLPLVATRVHAIPEVVAEGTGLLVPPGDAPALAFALEGLLASPEGRRRLGDAGRRHVRANYTLEEFGTRAERLFRSLVESRTRAV